jgi:hypothetical protein
MKISAHVSHQFNAFLSSRPAKWVMHAGAHRQRWASRSPYACSQDSRQHGRTRIIAVGILRRGPRCLRLLFRVAGVAGMAGCAGCGGFGGARLPPWLPPWLGAGAREETGAKLQLPHTCTGPCPHALGTLTLTSEAKAEKAAFLTASHLRQRFQQRPGLLQIHSVKALGEPAVDRRQQLVGFSALALLLPETSQAHGGA